MNPTEPTNPPADANAAPADAQGEELIRKVYVRDLREKQHLQTVFKVTRKQRLQARSGKAFLALSLADRTGEVDARIFENVDAAEGLFQGNDYVLVSGHVILFHGKPQLVVEKLQRLDPEPIDAKEFTPPPAPPAEKTEKAAPAAGNDARESRGGEHGDRPVQQIRQLTERVQDPHVKALMLAFLDDPELSKGLETAPAAKGVHHAYKGGLADHLLSVMKLSHRVADHYPMLDRDLLLAGALLHDIGKVQELTMAHGNIEYTDEGKLVGHLVMTAQKIREKASRISGFPRALEQHLTHLVLAHHGHLEYGSPKLPMTLEAQVVHLIDLLDSRVHSWLDLMAKDTGSNEKWTETAKLYDRQLWKAAPPTSRGRSPIEGRKGAGPRREKKPRPEGAAAGTPGEKKPAPQGEGRPQPKEKAEKKGAGVPTFKPLAALAGSGSETESSEASEPRATAPEGTSSETNGGTSNPG